jgi:hypothetical protein
VPRLIGRTEHAQQKKAVAVQEGCQWDETSFFEALLEKSPEGVAPARRVLEWAQGVGSRVWYGKGTKDGSLGPILEHRGIQYYLIVLWTYGRVELQFQSLQTRPPFDQLELRQEFQRRLNSVPGISIPDDRLSKRPSFPLAVLRSESALEEFIAVLDWAADLIRNR